MGPGRTTTSVRCWLITQCVTLAEAKNADPANAIPPTTIAQVVRRFFITASPQRSSASKADEPRIPHGNLHVQSHPAVGLCWAFPHYAELATSRYPCNDRHARSLRL